MKSGQEKAIPGFGPACMPELRAVGIHDASLIQQIGWEEAFLRWVERFPNRINVNAAVGMLAVERGVTWRDVSEADKERVRRFVSRLRERRRE